MRANTLAVNVQNSLKGDFTDFSLYAFKRKLMNFFQHILRIAAEMNTAKNELLPLTPSCGENGQNNQEMENWQLHCDRNGNGLIEDGEVVETVKVWADIRI